MKAQSIKLKSITSKITKGTTPTTMGFDFIDYGINFIKAEALNGDSELDAEGFAYINDDAHNKLKRSILQKNDVLVTIAGVNIGKTGIVKQKHLPANTNQAVGIVRIKPDLASSVYIYYWFKNPLTFKHLQNINAQAAQPNINLEMLGDLSLFLPNIQTQQKIASTIFIYDELINNNRRRIQLLEESARLLFREWFVYFRFPRLRQGFGGQAGHEKACPVESINSTGVKIVDGVPEGWKKEHLSKLVTTQYGYTETASQEEIGPKFLRGTDINKTSYIDWASVPYCPNEKLDFRKYSLSRGDILIIRMADPGKVGIVEVEIEAIFASYLVRLKVINKSISSYYLFYSLLGDKYQGFIIGSSTGSTRKSASAKLLVDYNLLIPKKEIIDSFDEQIVPIRKEINILLQQNQKLAQARDLLLPRLMSGAIEA